jgi:hypothetical protein
MAHQIISHSTLTRREVLGTYPTYLDAKRAAYDRFEIVHFEHDADVTYDAADFLTEQGAIYSIDPAPKSLINPEEL